MSCSNLKNNTNDVQLEKLGLIEIQSNETYISKLIEAIEDLDDVQNVYSNFDIDDKLLDSALTI